MVVTVYEWGDDGCGGIWYWRWQGVNYVNQMRAQWASVPYILLKKDSRETGNLVIFALDRGNSQRSENSVHYSGPCGSVLEVAVEHFFIFLCFCSTFISAPTDFGPVGRQKWGISTSFCLLLVPHAPNFDKPVDKNQTFPPVFVYF